jgi:hypothetical protein
MTNAAPEVDAAISGAVFASSISRDSGRKFRALLHHSLTTGCVSMSAKGLGPQTVSALSAVAQAHPEASVQLIVAAYEAFAREQAAAAILD